MVRGKELRDRVLDAAEELTGIAYLKKDGQLMIDAFTLAIEKALAEGKDIDIRGFGRFKVHSYPERVVTWTDGETHTIPPRNGVKFAPGKRLKREIAQGIVRPAERTVRDA